MKEAGIGGPVLIKEFDPNISVWLTNLVKH